MGAARTRDAPPRGSASAPVPGALLERQRELASVERLIDDAARGMGRALLIEGVPGIGKTRVLRESARLARERGLAVTTARGTELERTFAFGIVHQLLDPVVRAETPGALGHIWAGAAALARPVFELRPTIEATADPSHAVLHGLYWLVANVAERGPLLIAIDDAHWSDRPSGTAPRVPGPPYRGSAGGARARCPRSGGR